MKTKFLVALALIFSVFMTSSSELNPKLLIGKWCNPYTYKSSGEIKGFEFKKGGKCNAINIPSLDLKAWEIKDGKLIITGFEIAEDGTRTEYRTAERIETLTEDQLVVVSSEGTPKLAFRYVKVDKIKEYMEAEESKK